MIYLAAVRVCCRHAETGAGATRNQLMSRSLSPDNWEQESIKKQTKLFVPGLYLSKSHTVVLDLIWRHGAGLDEEDVRVPVLALGPGRHRAGHRDCHQIPGPLSGEDIRSSYTRTCFKSCVKYLCHMTVIKYQDLCQVKSSGHHIPKPVSNVSCHVTVIRYRDLCQVRSTGHHIYQFYGSKVTEEYQGIMENGATFAAFYLGFAADRIRTCEGNNPVRL